MTEPGLIRTIWDFSSEEKSQRKEPSIKIKSGTCPDFILVYSLKNYFSRPFFLRVRRVEVATLILTFLPSTTRVRFWMFGLKTLRVFLWEKDTLCPYILPLPEISQTAILFLLNHVNDSFERLWLVNSKIS